MTQTETLSPELALAAGFTLLGDEQLAAALDGLLSSSSIDWDRFLLTANQKRRERSIEQSAFSRERQIGRYRART